MSLSKPGLPSTWSIFVDQVALGADPVSSATSLGYSSPKAAAAALLKHPSVRKALRTAAEARLECEAVPLALDAVSELLQDRDPKARAVRAKLAVAILDRTREKADPRESSSLSLADMSMRQLEQLVAQLGSAGILPGQMRDVTPHETDPADVLS